MSLLQVQNAAFRYDGKDVVTGLNFTVEHCDYLCIVGENGSGKSTLVKGLLGLKAPHNGTITFGEGLTARQIGYLPQQKESQRDGLPWDTDLPWQGEGALLTRPHDAVQWAPLPHAGCALLDACAAGATFEDAAAQALQADPAADLPALVALLLRTGALRAPETPLH